MSTSLQRRVQKILSSSAISTSSVIASSTTQPHEYDEQATMINALETLSSLLEANGGNTMENRASLRSLLEQRHCQLLQTHLTEHVQPIKQQIIELDSSLQSLQEQCTQLHARLHACKREADVLVSKNKAIDDEKTRLEGRLEFVESFLASFHLSPADSALLDAATNQAENTNGQSDISDEFLRVMTKMQTMRDQVAALLKNQHQRMGLDLLDSLGKRLDNGYERLYRWVQQEVGQLSKVSDISIKLTTAFCLLRNMPVYYDHCCQELAQTRRVLLLGRFMRALQRGGPNGYPRPIELSAHDPVRYTSDILAWIHQALASEKEFLEALFGDEPPTPAQIEALQSVSSLYTNADLLASIFEGLCRGIKSRIEQSFVVHPGNIEILFKIYQVLQFYSTLISPLFKGSAAQLASPTSTSISSSSSLASTSTSSSSSTSTSIPSTSSSSPALLLSLKELESSCKTHFLDALRKQGERLIKTPMKPAQDLQPTPLMLEMTQNLSQLLSISQSSMLSSTERDTEFSPILSAIIQPLLESMTLHSKELEQAEQLVFQINVLTTILNILLPFEFVRSRYEIISLRQNEVYESLVAQQSSVLLTRCGLHIPYGSCLTWRNMILQARTGQLSSSSVTVLATLPGMEQTHLYNLINSFYTTLFNNAGSFSSTVCDRILHAPLRRSSRLAIIKSVSHAYQLIYQILTLTDPILHDAINAMASYVGYADITVWRTTLKHTPQQVDVLLDIPQDENVKQ